MKPELQGFAYQTTGGLNGVVYLVTNNSDYSAKYPKGPPGSLRYGVMTSDPSKPLWIKFAKDMRINVIRPLLLRSNMTLDGRGANVTLTTVIDWNLYQERPPRPGMMVSECERKPGVTLSDSNRTMLRIDGQRNIIVTNINFTRDNFENPAFDPKLDATMDKECLGKVISISDVRREGKVTSVNNIWLNRLTIEKCGDGCIDMTRPSQTKHFISISNSTFNKTYKTMILGTPYDVDWKAGDPYITPGKYYYRVSLYGNYFYQAISRNPRASASLVHMYNNKFENVVGYIVANYNSRVFFERNILVGRAPASVLLVINAPPDENGIVRDTNDPRVSRTFFNQNSGPLNVPDQDFPNYEQYRNNWITAPFTFK